MKKTTESFYARPGFDYTQYGFAKTELGYIYRKPGCRSGLYVDGETLQISPVVNWCSINIAVVIKMAANCDVIIK